jgi:hypothetical protein
MAFISFDEDTVIEYTPEYGNNRQDKTPLIIGLKFVGYGRASEYAKQINSDFGRKIKGKKAEDYEAIRTSVNHQIQKKQFMDNVDYIKNWKLSDGKGNLVDCDDKEKFFKLAPAAVILEIIRAMEDNAKLTENQSKN